MPSSHCYNCQSDESTHYASENGFSLVKCNGCGLLFVERMPDPLEISQAHKQGLHRGNEAINVTGRFDPSKVPFYAGVLQELFGAAPGGIKAWLDVGCGHGEFIQAARNFCGANAEVVGSEPNIHKQKSAQKHGLNVGYFDLEQHAQSYDVISILNVYSHLPNPPSFVNLLKSRLNPGGELILETGDTANLPCAQHPKPFYLPDHLSFASEKIVVDILVRSNFEILKVVKYPFVRRDPRTAIKEFIKLFVPKHTSRLPYLLSPKTNLHTDMFIRARLRG
jgi:SAM-dependent methyltransferase